MKIAFNAIRVSNKAGSGFDTFIINFVNEFAKYVYENPQLNISFDVFTLYPQHFPEVKKENIKQIKLPFLKQKVASSQSVKKNNVPVKNKLFFPYLLTPIYYLLSTTYYAFADYFRMFWTQFVFPFQIKKYDLVVALTEYEGLAFCRKQIIVIHNTVPFLFPEFSTKYRFYTYKLLPKIVKRCKKIITVSEVLKEEISRIFKVDLENIIVIHEGVNSKLFYPADRHEVEKFQKQYEINGDYILTVGHNHPIKNFSGVLAAFSLVKKKQEINLVIVGYIDRKIKVTEGVKYIGHLPNEKLYLLYTGAKCFVFPTFHEGFGLPPLEAMSCGCPVVVSNKGSLPEVCGDAAVYVNPYDPQDIANGILKVLTDKNLQAELVKKGFEQVKKFTWENTAKKFVEVLKNLQNNGIN